MQNKNLNRLILVIIILFNISAFSQNSSVTVVPFKQHNNLIYKENNSVIIHTHPEGAKVTVDTVFYGFSPIIITNINVKHIELQLFYNGAQRNYSISDLTQKTELFFVVDGDYGLLNLTTDPDSADIYINHVPSGTSPLVDYAIAAGYINIKIEKDDYELVINKFQAKNTRYYFNYKLISKYGALSLASQDYPEIKIDGKTIENEKFYNQRILAGSHIFEATPRDFHHVIHDELDIKNETDYKLNLDYNYFSLKYFSRSMLVPGLGQFTDGAKIKGAGIFIAAILSGGLFFNSYSNYKSQLNDVKRNRQLYLDADNETEALTYRRLLKSSNDKLSSNEKTKNIMLGAFIGVYVVNLIDALLFHNLGGSFSLEKREKTETGLIDTINFNVAF